MTPDEARRLAELIIRSLSIGFAAVGLMFQVVELKLVGLALFAACGAIRLEAWAGRSRRARSGS